MHTNIKNIPSLFGNMVFNDTVDSECLRASYLNRISSTSIGHSNLRSRRYSRISKSI